MKMLRSMCKSKIHRATVTEANLNYVGSITIDRELMAAAGILPYERVQIVNINNGTRVETYVLPGEKGKGTVCLNGAAARWAAPGDLVIIISYGLYSDEEIQRLQPRIVFVDEKNRISQRVDVDLQELDC
jgi:aspartate 1-decarboxylase